MPGKGGFGQLITFTLLQYSIVFTHTLLQSSLIFTFVLLQNQIFRTYLPFKHKQPLHTLLSR